MREFIQCRIFLRVLYRVRNARSAFYTGVRILYPVGNAYYYISKLVRALRLANLAGRTLLHGLLKFKGFFVAKMLRDLSPNFLYLCRK